MAILSSLWTKKSLLLSLPPSSLPPSFLFPSLLFPSLLFPSLLHTTYYSLLLGSCLAVITLGIVPSVGRWERLWEHFLCARYPRHSSYTSRGKRNGTNLQTVVFTIRKLPWCAMILAQDFFNLQVSFLPSSTPSPSLSLSPFFLYFPSLYPLPSVMLSPSLLSSFLSLSFLPSSSISPPSCPASVLSLPCHLLPIFIPLSSFLK